jgi:hypothetical protein
MPAREVRQQQIPVELRGSCCFVPSRPTEPNVPVPGGMSTPILHRRAVDRTLPVELQRAPSKHRSTCEADTWEGTPSDLFDLLKPHCRERDRKFFPANARSLSNRLRRDAPALRNKGVRVITGVRRGRGKRVVLITSLGDANLGDFASPSVTLDPVCVTRDHGNGSAGAENVPFGPVGVTQTPVGDARVTQRNGFCVTHKNVMPQGLTSGVTQGDANFSILGNEKEKSEERCENKALESLRIFASPCVTQPGLPPSPCTARAAATTMPGLDAKMSRDQWERLPLEMKSLCVEYKDGTFRYFPRGHGPRRPAC